MSNTFEKTFLISTREIKLAYSFSEYKFNKFFLRCSPRLFHDISSNNKLFYSFETMRQLIGEDVSAQNIIAIESDTLTIIGSDMNTQSIYYIEDSERNTFAVFNDLMLAKDILEQSDLPVEYDPSRFMGSFRYVKRLQPGERIDVDCTSDNYQIDRHFYADLLDQPIGEKTIEEAGEVLYNSLYEATDYLTKDIQEVFVSLSGGVDSTTIAYILKKLNKKITAFTIGTSWGNEYKEAQESADFLGIKLNRIHINGEEIVREIPQVIRYFGFSEPVLIEIALVAFCLYKKIREEIGEGGKFVTGYGSDLLNAGVYSPFNHYSELFLEILFNVWKTRISNEFCNLAALNLGIEPVHPFWHSTVIKEAFRVHPAHKVKDEKDKYYFRKIMEKKLPFSIAWRKKRGAHCGTGINRHLKNAIWEMCRVNFKESDVLYEDLFKIIHKQLFLFGKCPEAIDFTELLEA